MESSYAPPVLYLTDDDDDNPVEQHTMYSNSLKNTLNENLPHKKRKLPNNNAQINQSRFPWSKRQRNDHYLPQQIPRNPSNHEPETIVLDPDEPVIEERESHSFVAFDWTHDTRPVAPPPTPFLPPLLRTFSNPIQPVPRLAIPPQHTIMNMTKHHSDQTDARPLIPVMHQNDRYIQSIRNKPVLNFPIPSTSSPPLTLPLPASASAFTRPTLQRPQSTKNSRIPFSHPAPPPQPSPSSSSTSSTSTSSLSSSASSSSSSSLSSSASSSSSSVVVPHRPEPLFPLAFHPPPPTVINNIPTASEIRRQALNGNAILSAFYDSKYYRCNICKFKAPTSSALLHHLFTHIFFCRQCSFYSFSQHNLYQHLFEKHNLKSNKDNIDPKSLDLLYITRYHDGTFALCMDSAATKTITQSARVITNDEQPSNSSITIENKKSKRKTPKKKETKPNNTKDNDVVVLPQKKDTNPQPSTSKTKQIISPTEKQSHTYVVMKHRRCFSMKLPFCLHSLTLEYNTCREHTVRRMLKKKGLIKRQKLVPTLQKLTFTDEVASCLKTIVNDIVDMEDNRNSHNLICKLPNNILNSIFPTDDLVTITNLLKLRNKFEKTMEHIEQYDYEHSIRANNQHMFILSASDINQNEQTIVTSLHLSVTNSDSNYMQTPLHSLPISYDNTARFLKGTTRLIPQTISLTPKPSSNPEAIPNLIPKSFQRTNSQTTPPMLDRNNNAITMPKAKSSSVPSVIVLD